MSASAVVLSVALYAILKATNKELALLALSWRIVEAVFGGVAGLAGLAAL